MSMMNNMSYRQGQFPKGAVISGRDSCSCSLRIALVAEHFVTHRQAKLRLAWSWPWGIEDLGTWWTVDTISLRQKAQTVPGTMGFMKRHLWEGVAGGNWTWECAHEQSARRRKEDGMTDDSAT